MVSTKKKNQPASTGPNSKIVVKTKRHTHIFKSDDIVRCESDRNYTMIYFSDGKKMLSSKTLKYFDDHLTKSGFLRIHQSHLINPDFMTRFENGKNTGSVTLSDSTSVPVSFRKKTSIREFFELFEMKYTNYE
ncbi:MAG: hypothetical protein A2W91_06805 [Bacteroidetes bacterium GWF2_38_335]|nr:MAG: hypothetical protein A2W91_06805 [Bacteroidetes bacterium GWF2_38_335]OFY80912.1 MAG: hypothetical protein A2281_04900 [Bacteroidetes bacterium RIFOXYA12_FULL_38_20]HBS84926.1 hypothetical protein [Bacteroidales bacterium]